VVRSLTTFAIFGLSASGVDILDLFVFSGAFCNSYLAMILPCLLYMRWFGIGENKLGRWTKFLLWGYMVLGSTGAGTSVGFLVYDMANRNYVS
jgi:hypothetical protein